MWNKLLDPKNDLAFKRIFGSEKNKDILIHFLNDIFGRTENPVESVTFLKSNQDPDVSSQRTSIVDILCKDSQGSHFIVEMQVGKAPGFEKRAQYYAAKTYIQQRDKDSDYQDLKEVTFLAIMDYTIFPEIEEYISHHIILEKKRHLQCLKDFSFSFLELPKFKKSKEQLVSMVDKWAYFFKNAEQTKPEDLQFIIGGDPIVERAYKELDRFGWSLEELRAYDGVGMKASDDRARFKHAKQSGVEEGLQKGLEEGLQKGLEKAEKKRR